MEKKAKHFVRLLARKLTENEQTKGHSSWQAVCSTTLGPAFQESLTVEQAFRNALDGLPKSALKTELQSNAATYSRRLGALTKNGRAGSSSQDIERSRNGRQEEEPSRVQQESQVENADNLGSSQTRKAKIPEVGRVPSSQKSSKKGQEKSGSKAITSGDSPTKNGSDEGRTDDAVAAVTHLGDEKNVARIRPSGTSAKERFSFGYNSYTTDAKSRVMDSLRKLSLEEKRRLAPHAYACLGRTSSFNEFLQTLHPDGNPQATSDTLTLLKQEILAGIGAPDVKVYIRSMADCLSGVILEADEVLDSKNCDRLKELQGFILNFLQWAKMQHGHDRDCERRQDKQAQSVTNFDDLMDAILSIYIDISIVLSRDNQEKAENDGRHTLCKILLLIGHSRVEQLNLLLQITQPTAQDCRFMLPIYKHMLKKKPSAMTNEVFVKYICAVKFSQQVLRQEQQVMQHIVNVAMTAEPSQEFLQWLFSVAPDAYSSLPDAVKSRKVSLVRYLTEEAPRDYLDRLLDIVCDEENESQALSYEDSQAGQALPGSNSQAGQALPGSNTQEDQAVTSETEGLLFFTDTGRDEALAQQLDSDSESVDALHSRLDALMEGIDQEESSSDGDEEEFVRAVKPTGVKAKGRASTVESLGDVPPPPPDSDGQSDFDEVDMDTSAASEQNVPQTLSFEEQRHKLMMEARGKSRNVSGVAKNNKGCSVPTRPAKTKEARSRKSLSLSSRARGRGDDVLVVPETQGYGDKMDSDRESFATAKENLDSTRESIIIDVDEEITFKVKAAHPGIVEMEEVEGDDMEDEEAVQDDVEVLDVGGDEDEEDDSGKEKGLSSNASREKASTRGPKNPQKALEEVANGEHVSDEPGGSAQRMHLRSAGTGRSQSSLLRFFSPVSRSGEESNSDLQATQSLKRGKCYQPDGVELVPDSCESADEETRNDESGRQSVATPQRAKNLKSLQEISTDPEQTRAEKSSSAAADAAEASQGKDGSPTPRIHKRLPRSARKTRGTRPRVISSSDSDVDPAILLSPVIGPSQTRAQSSKQEVTVVEDAVSEGIRRIREECATAPSDLQQQPAVTRSGSKLKSSKRKSLTITGGIKSRSLAVSTPRQPDKRAESSTPGETTGPRSAEKKRQGVSPLSPSKVKRVATFGDTYRILAGISADSQTEPGSLPASLPASQSQKTSPKRARLQPKALGEMFDEHTPGKQKKNAKKQTADVRPLSGSSQESAQTGRSSSSSIKRLTKKAPTPAAGGKKTPARTPSVSSQEDSASQAKQPKRSKAKGSPALDSSLRSDDVKSQKAAIKRRASLPSTKAAKKSAKVNRKSTGAKM